MLISVSYKFGLVAMFAGILGVPLGPWIASRLRPRLTDCDPLVCGFALLTSAPLIYFALVAVATHVPFAYVLIFCGMITLNLTWSIVADMVLVRYSAYIFNAEISHRDTIIETLSLQYSNESVTYEVYIIYNNYLKSSASTYISCASLRHGQFSA